MPIRICPACEAETRRVLEGASADAYVWYYRCAKCGHTWAVSKADGTIVHHVTPLPTDEPPEPPPSD